MKCSSSRSRRAWSASCSCAAWARPQARPWRSRGCGRARIRPIWACRCRGWSSSSFRPRASSRHGCAGRTSCPAIGASASSPRGPSMTRASTSSAMRSNSKTPAIRARGLLFDGRVAEDFKLTTGTWVNVGPLRARLLAQLEPYARDVVIAGADRDEIGVLIFPNLEACRKLAAGVADVTGDARVRDELRARLTAFARTSTGSSNRVCRAILVGEPPSLDAGEMTDKGSINQRALLERRADLVAELYAAEPSPRVLVIDEGR